MSDHNGARIAERWNEIDRLYDEALALAVVERTRFLTQSCGADTELFDTVSRLLVASGQAEGMLTGPPPQLLREALSSVSGPGAASPGVGDRVGHYQIVREVTRGGMATVYEAERADGAFQQRVAIKTLRGVGSDDVTRRFLAERDILSGLSHPHISRLLDGGTTDRGQPYLVMEWVHGERITHWADARCLDTRGRVALLQQVARAVHYAHTRLVIHRDIKPSNVLVDADGRAHLLDFGIAKLLEAERIDDPDTRTGTRWMTPEYAAPEQLLGQSVTTATDVYALGVVLHELLTGRRPLDGEGSDARVAVATGERGPPPASTVVDPNEVAVARLRGTTPAGLRKALSGDLDAIVAKALRHAPEDRYASPRELADDLQRHLEARPVEARAGLRAYRMRRFVARNRAGVAASGLALGALVVGFGAALWQAELAGAEAVRAQEVRAFTLRLFEGVDPGGVSTASGGSLTVQELLERATERVEVELAGDPSLRAEMFTLLGSIHLRLADHDVARGLLERSVDLHASHTGSGTIPHANATFELAKLEHRTGNLDRAADLYASAHSSFTRAAGTESDEVGRVEREMARLAHVQGRYEDADALFRAARAKLAASGAHASELVLLDLDHLGTIHTTEDTESIERVFQRIVADGHHLDEQRVLVAQALLGLGRGAAFGERAAEAEPLMRQALEIRRRLLGEPHPDVAMAMAALAAPLERLGRFEEALETQRGGVAMLRETLGSDHMDYARELGALAVLMTNVGDQESAIDLFRQVEPVQVQAHGESHLHVAMTRRNLGRALQATGRQAEALPVLERGLESWIGAMGDRGFYPPETRLDIAAALAANGMHDRADSLLMVVFEAAGAQPARAGLIGHAHVVRARILAERGRIADAIESARAALERHDADGIADGSLARARAKAALGELLLEQGELAEAELHLVGAYETLIALRGPSGREPVAVRAQLQRLYTDLGRPDEARRYADSSETP